MKTGRFIQLNVGLIFMLILLTACDGSVNTDFSVNNDGFDFQTVEPKFFAKETFTTEFPLVNHMRIRLEAIRGNIQIDGRENTDSVTVIAQKRVGSYSLEDAEENLNELEILVTDQIDEVLIQTLQPDNIMNRKYIVDYQIIIPKDLEIEVVHTNGDINVINIENWVTVDSENGDVFLTDISASVIVTIANGSINSSVDLPLDGEIILSTNNGDIDLSIPSSTSAGFAASINNGLIQTFNLEFEDAVQTIQSLSGTLGDGDGVIDLGSINGYISVVGIN
jgi:phosphohistidine swiveling domain-containing protein